MNFSPQEWNSAVAIYNVGSRLVVTWCDYRKPKPLWCPRSETVPRNVQDSGSCEEFSGKTSKGL